MKDKTMLLTRAVNLNFNGISSDGLNCPVCNGAYLKATRAETYETDRGYGTRSRFECESGCHTQMNLTLIMQFHKGTTYFMWGDQDDVFQSTIYPQIGLARSVWSYEDYAFSYPNKNGAEVI
jgi:hypothetical protein